MTDAITVLKKDHRRVEELFERFAGEPDAGLARQICEELAVHAAVEEEFIYPLLRTKVDRALADEARREHGEAWDVMAEIEEEDLAIGIPATATVPWPPSL